MPAVLSVARIARLFARNVMPVAGSAIVPGPPLPIRGARSTLPA